MDLWKQINSENQSRRNAVVFRTSCLLIIVLGLPAICYLTLNKLAVPDNKLVFTDSPHEENGRSGGIEIVSGEETQSESKDSNMEDGIPVKDNLPQINFTKIENPTPSFEKYAYLSGDLVMDEDGIIRINKDAIGSKNIQRHSIESAHIDGSSITSRTIRNNSIRGKDINQDTEITVAEVSADNLTAQNLAIAESIDLGTNEISDGIFTGDWDFGSGNLTTLGIISGNFAGSFSPSEDVDMANYILTNIGNAGTDFTASGGLNLAGNLASGGSLSGTTLNTGQGNYELYAMDQNVLTTSTPIFGGLTLTGMDGILKASSGTIEAAIAGTDYIAGGVGTQYYVPYFSATGVLANSNIFYDGTNVGIGTTAPNTKLHVYNGNIHLQTNNGGRPNFLIDHSATGTYWMQTIQNDGRFDILNSNDIDATPVMSLKNNSGNIGIGTTEPAAKMHVYSSSSYNAYGYFSASGTGNAGIVFDASNGDMAGSDYGSLYQSNDLKGHLDMGSGNALIFQESGGYVGIGTTAPGAKLDVLGTMTLQNTGTNSSYFYINRPTTSQASAIQFQTAGTSDWVVGSGYSGTTSDFRFYKTAAAAGDVMTLTTAGYVGIGTTAPSQKLDVAGNINTTGDITITNSDPTMVFASTTVGALIGAMHQNGNILSLGTLGLTDMFSLDLETGNIGFGTTSFGTSGTKVIAIGLGMTPTSSPADISQIWSADLNGQAGHARLHERTESGIVSPIALQTEVDAVVNPKAMAQGVHMTYAASGSTGIAVADDDDIDFGTGDFTLVWKGSLPDWTPDSAVVLIQKEDGVAFGYRLQATTTGKLHLYCNVGGINVYSTVEHGFTDGTEHEIVVSIVRETAGAAGSVTYYTDGVILGTATAIAAGAPTTVSNTSTLYFSGYATRRQGSVNKTFILYNRALSASEVLDLYRNGIAFADKYGSQTAVYTSDFSAGADSWNGTGGTAAGNIDGIGGEDNVLRLTSDNSTGQHRVSRTVTTIGEKYRISFRYYIPSANTTIKKIRTNYAPYTYGDTLDAWTTYTIDMTGVADTTSLILYGVDAASGVSYTGTTGDLLYIKDIVITKLGSTLALEPEGIQSDKWYDSSSNGLNASYPASGSSLTRRIASPPAFLATNAEQLNVTGDGTVYLVKFATEIADRGGNFSDTTFTAPVTGLYQLNTAIQLKDLPAGNTLYGRIDTSNRSYYFYYDYISACSVKTIEGSILADMDAGDVAQVVIYVGGSSKVVDLAVGVSYFSGVLIN